MDVERRKAKLAILRSYAERHFCNAMPMHTANLWRGVICSILVVPLWVFLSQDPEPGGRSAVGLLLTASILAAVFFLYLGFGQATHVATSWAGKFIGRLHDYVPVDRDAYDDFCKALLANGIQIDAVMRWLAHEEAAMESQQKAYAEHVRALASELPAGDIRVVSELEAYVASLDVVHDGAKKAP